MSLFNSFLLPETTAYLAQCSPQPSAKWTNALNKLIRQLIIDGNWQLLDRMWILATESRNNAILSIVNPGSSTSLSEVPGSGTLYWTARYGYTSDGAHSYINTNFAPGSGSNQYTETNASFGVYLRTVTTRSSPSFDIGAGNGTYGYGLTAAYETSNNKCLAEVNDGSFALNAPLSAGLISASRTSGSSYTIYYNGASTYGAGATAFPIISETAYLCGSNQSNISVNFSPNQNSMAFFGSGNIDQTKFYNAFYAFITSI